MTRTRGTKGRLTLREACRGGKNKTTTMDRDSGQLRDQLRLAFRSSPNRIVRQPLRKTLLMIKPSVIAPPRRHLALRHRGTRPQQVAVKTIVRQRFVPIPRLNRPVQP